MNRNIYLLLYENYMYFFTKFLIKLFIYLVYYIYHLLFYLVNTESFIGSYYFIILF